MFLEAVRPLKFSFNTKPESEVNKCLSELIANYDKFSNEKKCIRCSSES